MTKLDALYDLKLQKLNLKNTTSSLYYDTTTITNSNSNSPTKISNKSFYDSLRNHIQHANNNNTTNTTSTTTLSSTTSSNSRRRRKKIINNMGFFTSAPKSNPFVNDNNNNMNEANNKWHLTEDGEVVSTEIYQAYQIAKKNLPILYLEKNSILPSTMNNNDTTTTTTTTFISQNFDVFLLIEHCTDCMTHTCSLWHDEKKYKSMADDTLETLVEFLLNQGYPIRYS